MRGARRRGAGAALVGLLLGVLNVLGAAPARATAAPVSDDFSGAELHSRWTVVDPVGDSTVSLSGTGTSEARVVLQVPAGTAHDPWNDDRSLRLLQDVADVDLSVEVKYDSVPTARFQDQGLMLVQDSSRWLRFSVYSDGSRTYAFAASTTAGSSTALAKKAVAFASGMRLRLVRTGSTWTYSASSDGVQWTSVGSFVQALVLRRAGMHAGNGGSPAPGFAAAADWFFSTDSPVVPEDPVGDGQPSDGSSTPPATSTATPTATTAPSATATVSPDPSATPTATHSESATPTATPSESATSTATPSESPSPEPTSTPAPSPTATADGRLASDDFRSGLDATRWRTVDPSGDGRVSASGAGTADARVALSVPAGSSHDAYGQDRSLKLVQAVSDGDTSVEVGFDSVPSQKYQDQGLLFREDAGRWLRFSVYSDGSKRYAFAASTTAGSSAMRLKQAVALSSVVRLRAARAQATWTLSVSADGATWTRVGSFSESLTLREIGVYAGNSGTTSTNAPAHTALVDYVFESGNPLLPEDGGAPADVVAPVLHALVVEPGSTAVSLSWETDEPASGRVEHGTTADYTGSSSTSTYAVAHHLRVTGLTPLTTYHYRLVLVDTAGNVTSTQDSTFKTSAPTGPQLDVWYAASRHVAASFGVPQAAFNVLGNVSDGDGVRSLVYSLNGSAPSTLTLGPDTRRLEAPGDFNAEVMVDQLPEGLNALRLTATDRAGDVTSAVVHLTHEPAPEPLLPFDLRWDATLPVERQALPVDGLWRVDHDGARTVRTGYDRLLALGSRRWGDVEVTVQFTVHGFGPGAGQVNSNEPLIGLALAWQGHEKVDNKQPAWGFKTVGSYAWFRFYDVPKLEMRGNGGSPVLQSPASVSLGQRYLLKADALRLDELTSRYRAKLWKADAPEPAGWALSLTDTSPAHGSVAVFAHQLDATFGDVVVRAAGRS